MCIRDSHQLAADLAGQYLSVEDRHDRDVRAVHLTHADLLVGTSALGRLQHARYPVQPGFGFQSGAVVAAHIRVYGWDSHRAGDRVRDGGDVHRAADGFSSHHELGRI